MIRVFLFVDGFIDVLLIPNPRAISALFPARLTENQCVRGAKKKAEKRKVNAGRPITVTITAIVLLIQSIGGEDAPKTEGKKGEKKPSRSSRAPVLLSLRAECVGMLSASFHWPPLNGVLFFSISHRGVLRGVRSG